ncbi:MAG: ribosome-associated translation inhibitor RaiA [Myxococcales bacterium]|nr:MAG: ribosome-associated translation inhibitor RaiA [Myxococcales bacterium]
MDPSDALREYARHKVARLQKYSDTPLDAEITASLDGHLQCIDMNISADGNTYLGHEGSDSLYASVDLVMDKIDRQIRRSKKYANQRRRRSSADAMAKPDRSR